MKQDRIWDYFQNEAPESFASGKARGDFLARRLIPGSKALNIGAGAFSLEESALARGVDVYTLDPSEKTIAALRDRLKIPGRARAGYSQNIPFADGFFDAVIVSELFEHLDDGVLEKTVSEIYRVMAPGGRLLGTVPSSENLSDQTAVCPDCGRRFHRWGHVRSFDAENLARLLSGRFNIDEAVKRTFVTWPSLNWKGKLEAFLKSSLRLFGLHGSGETIYFSAKKIGTGFK